MLKRIISYLLIIFIIFSYVPAIIPKVEAYTPSQSNALTYGSDRFSPDYALGYFCIGNTISVGCSAVYNFFANTGSQYPWYTTTIKGRNANVYLNHYNAAYMSGKYYDIREYIWAPDGGTMGIYSANRWSGRC